MATMRFAVLALAIMLATASNLKGKSGSAVSVGELRELLVSSMQTTISLTALVEQQTQKIGDIENFVDAAKEEIKELGGKLTASEDKLEQQTQKIQQQTQKIEQQTQKIEQQTQKIQQQTQKIDNITKEIQSRVKEVLVVSGEEALRDPSCARVCAGTTKRDSTKWQKSSHGYDYVYTYVDISNCGFVTVPTVTTSLEGHGSHWHTTGSANIYDVTTSAFLVHIKTDQSVSVANGGKWNMEWIAVGYTC